MASGTKFHVFVEDQARAKHDFGAHTFKWMLTSIAPVATNSVKADLTEIAAGNGYTAGGATVTMTLSRTSGVLKINGTDTLFLASGGAIGPFQHVVLYNDTAAGDPLVGWYSYPTPITLNDGQSFQVTINPLLGLINQA